MSIPSDTPPADTPPADPPPADPLPVRKTPLVFAPRNRPVEPQVPAAAPWRVLITDDEPEVHTVTRMLLKEFSFEGRGLEFLSAGSAAEACNVMRHNSDIAVLLLDVVMESEHSGLEAVRIIRRDIGNTSVRIILRTGQPGYAPEKQVVEEFDINDYREKADLTAQRLTTAMMSALRAYRDIRSLDLNRRGLERIIGAAGTLFEHQSLSRFVSSALNNATALLNRELYGLSGINEGRPTASGLAATGGADGFEVLAGVGKFSSVAGGRLSATTSPALVERLRTAMRERGCLYGEHDFVGYFPTTTGSVYLVYVEARQPLEDIDVRLLKVFASNLGFAFENVCLNHELAETGAEIVQTLSDVVETRSLETSRHTMRVGKCALLLGEKLGLPQAGLDVLRLAAPMHDLGKIGIPDALLNKPGKLTAEEYTCIKAHTTIGHGILAGSHRRLLDAAARVCLQHHERWDGDGYPKGLKGTEIDILGRIVCLADVFDAISNDRPYKKRWPPDQVLEYIEGERGRQFDPDLVDLFVANFAEFVALQRMEGDELPAGPIETPAT
ncbi:MAG: DUF3369 domain-containing protein [Rhodospirillaceae bacterium]